VRGLLVLLAVLVGLFSAVAFAAHRLFDDILDDLEAGRKGIREGDDELMKMVVDPRVRKGGGA
jgi:hypothetical protein